MAVSIKLFGGNIMGKRSKSKRFVQHGVNSLSEYDKRFPYRSTYAEAEAQKLTNDKGAL